MKTQPDNPSTRRSRPPPRDLFWRALQSPPAPYSATAWRFPKATWTSLLPPNRCLESTTRPAARPTETGNPNPAPPGRPPFFPPGTAGSPNQKPRNPQKIDSGNGSARISKTRAPQDDDARRFPVAPTETRNSPRRAQNKSANSPATDRMRRSQSMKPLPAASPPASPPSTASCTSASAEPPSCPTDTPKLPRLPSRSAAENPEFPDHRDSFRQHDSRFARLSVPRACSALTLHKTPRYPAAALGTTISAGRHSARKIP